jgi:hypothetical protein
VRHLMIHFSNMRRGNAAPAAHINSYFFDLS